MPLTKSSFSMNLRTPPGSWRQNLEMWLFNFFNFYFFFNSFNFFNYSNGFLTFYEKRKTHESVCFPTENVVPDHHDWGTDFRGVFRVGSKTMFFEILGGSRCRSIQKNTILGPRQERDGAPKSTLASFGGELFFCIFLATTREGKNRQSSEPRGARGPR